MGSGFFETIDRPGRSEVCLTEFGAKEWPAHPLEKSMRKWTGCSDAIDPPRGNALSGKRSCPKASATFEGSHTEDKFAIKGVVKWNDDGREETFAITGRRTGDC